MAVDWRPRIEGTIILAKASKPVDDEQDEAIETNAVPVVRDGNFIRATIDHMFTLVVGKDVELACLQMGQVITELANKDQSVRLDLTTTSTEMARLRMSWPAALGAAMNILRVGIETGNVDRLAVVEKLSKLEVLDESDGY
jgi:phage terminase large subunit GpA-like protein